MSIDDQSFDGKDHWSALIGQGSSSSESDELVRTEILCSMDYLYEAVDNTMYVNTQGYV
jgi:hypothetical protein